MAIPKLEKSQLASAVLLVTKSQKRAIHNMAKKERRSVTAIVGDMLEAYKSLYGAAKHT